MTDYNFEPRQREIAHHVISGFFNSGIIQAVKILCQFASIIVLSRLLPPADFGIVAMASPVYGFVTLFLDLGLGQATVQKPNLTHEETNAFFWINTAVGGGLTLILLAVSPLSGWYFHEPRVVAFTMAMAPLILISAIGSQPGAILRRRMEFGILAINDIIGSIAGLAASIIFALTVGGYWALYCGMATGTVVSVVGIYIASGWRPTMPRFVKGLSGLLKFGAALTLVNLLGYVSGTMDNILIGRKWGDTDLGLYDRAYKLLLFPLQRIVGPIAGTMIPVLSRLIDDPDRYRSIFLRTLSQIALIAWPGILWTVALGDPLLPTLLGEKWRSAVPIFEPLAIVGLLQVVNSLPGWLLVTFRRTSEYTKWGLVGAAANITSYVIGLPYGPVGVAIAYAVSQSILAPFYWWGITRRGPIRLQNAIAAILPQFFGGAASYAALLAERRLAAGHLSIIWLGLGLIISYSATALVMLLFPGGRHTLLQTLQTALRALDLLKKKIGK